jgi:flagellar hook-associated protein 2
MGLTQTAQNALATINGVAVVSATNRMTDTLPGLTVQLSQVTTAPVEIDVSIDPEGARKNIQAFVDAYNTLTKTLADATKFDPTSKAAGALQGDSTAVGLQNALRSMMRSVSASSPFSRLADVGIEAKSGGELSINATRFDAALTTNYEGLRQLFTVANESHTAQGFGLKIRTFAQGLIDSDGVVSARSEALQNALTRNGKEQDKVNDRAARAEVRLLAQYNAMDANVGRLSGLNAFVTQQIALWNKSTA